MTVPDLSWVAPSRHRRLLGEMLAELDGDERVIGVLLAGSLARGDALPGSDVDLVLLVAEGVPTEFRTERRDGILVERSYLDEAAAREQLAAQPMRVYTYLDGRVLRDDSGGLTRLADQARVLYAAFRTSPKERQDIAYWLRSARDKIHAALDAGDLLRAAYWTSTTSWKLLEGLWAAHDRPMPAGGGVWAHLGDLGGVTPGLAKDLHVLFLGETAARSAAMVALIDATLPLLEAGHPM